MSTGYYIAYFFFVLYLGKLIGSYFSGSLLIKHNKIEVLKLYLVLYGVLNVVMTAMPNYWLFLGVMLFQMTLYNTQSISRSCFRYLGDKPLQKRFTKQIVVVSNFFLIMGI